MVGAATLAVGNGMIEVAGNPLVAALYPEEKTTRLNWFHAFFPIGIVAGGLVGFVLATYGGRFGYWPYQLAVIYIPILVYGALVLPQQFPKTENAEVGIPVGEMFRYTLTSPLFLLMLAMMAITTSIELGPMRWVPAVLEAVGMHGILVLVWISGWMVVLRAAGGPLRRAARADRHAADRRGPHRHRAVPAELRAGAVVGARRGDDLRVGRRVLLPDDGGAGERADAADRIARHRADGGHRARHGGRASACR